MDSASNEIKIILSLLRRCFFSSADIRRFESEMIASNSRHTDRITSSNTCSFQLHLCDKYIVPASSHTIMRSHIAFHDKSFNYNYFFLLLFIQFIVCVGLSNLKTHTKLNWRMVTRAWICRQEYIHINNWKVHWSRMQKSADDEHVGLFRSLNAKHCEVQTVFNVFTNSTIVVWWTVLISEGMRRYTMNWFAAIEMEGNWYSVGWDLKLITMSWARRSRAYIVYSTCLRINILIQRRFACWNHNK